MIDCGQLADTDGLVGFNFREATLPKELIDKKLGWPADFTQRTELWSRSGRPNKYESSLEVNTTVIHSIN